MHFEAKVWKKTTEGRHDKFSRFFKKTSFFPIQGEEMDILKCFYCMQK